MSRKCSLRCSTSRFARVVVSKRGRPSPMRSPAVRTAVGRQGRTRGGEEVRTRGGSVGTAARRGPSWPRSSRSAGHCARFAGPAQWACAPASCRRPRPLGSPRAARRCAGTPAVELDRFHLLFSLVVWSTRGRVEVVSVGLCLRLCLVQERARSLTTMASTAPMRSDSSPLPPASQRPVCPACDAKFLRAIPDPCTDGLPWSRKPCNESKPSRPTRDRTLAPLSEAQFQNGLWPHLEPLSSGS
jgi:hypothetical protein